MMVKLVKNYNQRMLVLMHGSTFCGKSVTSAHLEQIMIQLFGGFVRLLHTSKMKTQLGISGYEYSALEHRTLVYNELARQAGQYLQLHPSGAVIVDGSFSLREWREIFYKVAQNTEAIVLIVSCHCENELELRARLDVRRKSNPNDPVNSMSFSKTERQFSENLLLDLAGSRTWMARNVFIIINDTYCELSHYFMINKG